MSTRTRIKICGITNIEDALAAVACGADALGFIRVADSPRYVDEEQVGRIVAALPPFINRVGVYHRLEDAHSVLDKSLFDTVQFYEAEELSDFAAKIRLVRAVRVRDESSLETLKTLNDSVGAILLDAYHPDRLGGSGAVFDWALACGAKAHCPKPLILAGGLTPDNVAAAIAAVRPYAVDVSSGVEASVNEATPGRKDLAKMRAFCRAVSETDLRRNK